MRAVRGAGPAIDRKVSEHIAYSFEASARNQQIHRALHWPIVNCTDASGCSGKPMGTAAID
eukprot:6559642-Pyramimonas_sp.AAC.1